MKGYKAFNKDLKCLDMQYEIGKEYIFDGEPILCKQGFHFCKSIADCYNFYYMSDDTRICEIIASGDITTDDEVKYCTNKIKIVSEVKNPRAKSNLSNTNSGYCNTGNCNTGDWNIGNWNTGNKNTGDWNAGNKNTGNCNTGDWNTGDWNIGDCNIGNKNTGYCNTGYCNTGNCNTGNRNTGDWNIGDCNTGDWNIGDWNTGVFNTAKKPKIKIFDAESEWTIDDWVKSKAYTVMDKCPCTHSELISSYDMYDEEKENHPEYKTIGGYIKTIVVTDKDKQEWWDALSSDERQAVYHLPNFDAKKFKMCTGITAKAESEDKE